MFGKLKINTLSVFALITFVFPLLSESAVWPLDSNKKPVSGAIQTFWVDPQNLWYNRELIRQGRKELSSPLNRIIRYADAALKDTETYCVTKKPADYTAPSGDPHDYYSLARFYWPNNSNPDGKPWGRRDGDVNPEIYKIPDSTWLKVVIDDVFNLGIAYFFTGNEDYAAKAAKRLWDWFINPDTRMNPNLNFANWIIGTPVAAVTGQQPIYVPGALLELSEVYKLFDGIGLIRNSKSFSNSDYQGLQLWFSTYLEWLEASPRGALESTSANNLGTWYDVQHTAVLFFLGQLDAASIAQQTTLQRIDQQFNVDGAQPLEQSRTNSWFYSNFNLQAYFVQVAFSQTTGIKMLDYVTEDGKSIIKGLDYLIPFALSNGTNWPVPNTGGFDTASLSQLCKSAFVVLKDTNYLDIANKLQNSQPKIWNPYRLWSPFGSYDTDALSLNTASKNYPWITFVVVSLSLLYSLL